MTSTRWRRRDPRRTRHRHATSNREGLAQKVGDFDNLVDPEAPAPHRPVDHRPRRSHEDVLDDVKPPLRDAIVRVDEAQRRVDGHVVPAGRSEHLVHALKLLLHPGDRLPTPTASLPDHRSPHPDPALPRLGVDDRHARRTHDEMVDVGQLARHDEVVQNGNAAQPLGRVVQLRTEQTLLALIALDDPELELEGSIVAPLQSLPSQPVCPEAATGPRACRIDEV